MPPIARHTARLAAIGLLAGLGLGATTLPSSAEDAPADTFVADARLATDGSLTVTQTLTFADAPDEIVQHLDTSNDLDRHRTRTWEVRDVSASVGGSEVKASSSPRLGEVVITVDTAEAGSQPVVISYTVDGATDTQQAANGDVTVVSWPLLQGLSVGATKVTGTLEVPGVPQLVDCTAGPVGAVDKCQIFSTGTEASPVPYFETAQKAPGEAVVFTVGLPGTAVPATAAITESWSLDRAFTAIPRTIIPALALLLLGAGALYAMFRRLGRDIADDEVTPVAGFVPTGPGTATFEVHDAIRPGHVGTLADERVDPVDVTASILDLAVRGYLRITELPRTAHGILDWKISRTPLVSDKLAPFESTLLDAVAPVGGSVLVSQLGERFSEAVPAVQDALYDDVVDRGWFDHRPDSTRTRWRFWGITVLLLAIIAALALVAFTRFGLLALVMVALGAIFLWLADRMPRRTRAGSRVLSGLGALSALLATHDVEQLGGGRIVEVSKVLPYSVVLGGRQRWVDALVAADDDVDSADPDAIDWYHAPDTWHLQDLPASLTQFVTAVQGHLYSR